MSNQREHILLFFNSKSTPSLDTTIKNSAAAPSRDTAAIMSARSSHPPDSRFSDRNSSVSQNKLEALFGFSELPPLKSKEQKETLDFGHHEEDVHHLRYTVWDLIALTADLESFDALKRSLRKNGAITNEMLKQGLPLFMHRNRDVIYENYLKGVEEEEEEEEEKATTS